MKEYERLTEKEREILRSYAEFIQQVSEHPGHIFNKEYMFKGIRESLRFAPMLNGSEQILNFYDEIEKL